MTLGKATAKPHLHAASCQTETRTDDDGGAREGRIRALICKDFSASEMECASVSSAQVFSPRIFIFPFPARTGAFSFRWKYKKENFVFFSASRLAYPP